METKHKQKDTEIQHEIKAKIDTIIVYINVRRKTGTVRLRGRVRVIGRVRVRVKERKRKS